MDGTEKLKLLLIGKSENPRCLNKMNRKKLPCEYDFQNKAWMNGNRFKNWLQKLDRTMVSQNRKILLFIDNCPAHPKDVRLKNIEMVFLPKNSTSLLQPMDQGIIKVLKQFYRKRLVMRYLSTIDNPGSQKPITILDAINYVASSWDAISSTTISNCFQKAGFTHGETTEADPIPDLAIPEDFERVGINFEEYVSIDDGVTTTEVQSLDSIIRNNDAENAENEPVAEMEVENELETHTVPSLGEALEYIDKIRCYLQSENVNGKDTDFCKLNSLENVILNSHQTSLVQSTLDSFLRRE